MYPSSAATLCAPAFVTKFCSMHVRPAMVPILESQSINLEGILKIHVIPK